MKTSTDMIENQIINGGEEKFAAFSFIRQEKCLTLLDNSVIITSLLKQRKFGNEKKKTI